MARFGRPTMSRRRSARAPTSQEEDVQGLAAWDQHPHEVMGCWLRHCRAALCQDGTGVIAGGTVRQILRRPASTTSHQVTGSSNRTTSSVRPLTVLGSPQRRDHARRRGVDPASRGHPPAATPDFPFRAEQCRPSSYAAPRASHKSEAQRLIIMVGTRRIGHRDPSARYPPPRHGRVGGTLSTSRSTRARHRCSVCATRTRRLLKKKG